MHVCLSSRPRLAELCAGWHEMGTIWSHVLFIIAMQGGCHAMAIQFQSDSNLSGDDTKSLFLDVCRVFKTARYIS